MYEQHTDVSNVRLLFSVMSWTKQYNNHNYCFSLKTVKMKLWNVLESFYALKLNLLSLVFPNPKKWQTG